MESLIYYNTEAQAKLSELVNHTKSVVVLCDTQTKKYCLPYLISQLPVLKCALVVCIPAGEKSKEWSVAMQIWDELLQNKLDRQSLLLNLGGGVVCDLGGFVASVFKRGISFVHIPTSLLAQVDAAIGGKTAINIHGVKNQIGTFQLPQAVCVFSEFLHTLPERHCYAGFAEMLKHGLIADRMYWEDLKTIRNMKQIISNQNYIRKSIQLKTDIVSIDFKDDNERKKLNFGHTVGHALESAFMQSKRNILHGEAVARGILAEAHISWQKGLLSQREFDDINQVIQFHFKSLSFPKTIKNNSVQLLHADKKRVGDVLNITLLKEIGTAVINQNCSDIEVASALSYVCEC